jgi:uncharacterized protein with HEPN domain
MRTPRQRIMDMLEAIARIEKHTSRGRTAFDNDELIRTFVVHYLQVIGEAASQLPKQFQDRHPEVPWSEIRGTRHILVHGYFLIDLDIVWSVVEKDLPGLRQHLEAILPEIEGTIPE